MPNNHPDRVALVTGAMGGLGQALVHEFLTQGWRVVAGSRDNSRLKKANDPGSRSFDTNQPNVLPLPKGEGRGEGEDERNPWSVTLDVTNHDDTEAVVRQILQRWKRIDLLINNAGVTSDAALNQMSDAEWDHVLSVNLKGAFLCSQAVLRPMLRQRSGHIVNISSFSGRVGARGQSNYAAAKAGLFGLTASLAQEVGSRNIRVNAVLPGVLPTRMTSHVSTSQMGAFAQANTLGRINSLEEVARFVAFLATTENISGQLFQLDSRIAPWT